MNPEAQELLDSILKKNPEDLNEEEQAFVRARSSYLKKSQLEEFKDILHPKHQTSEKETVKPHDTTKSTK